MGARVLERMRAVPVILPLLVAVALMLVGTMMQGAFPLGTWSPGTLFAIALLGLALVLAPPRLADVPVAVRVALLALAAFTAWSFLSILWAGERGVAWEGANRTLLYLVVFALFALWRQRSSTAGLVLGAWTAGMIALVVYVALAIASDPGPWFRGDRLLDPAGYQNASAVMWMMALWPAVALAAAARVPWGLRAFYGAGAVVLAGVALLSLSRGALFAAPVVLVLFVAAVPGRLRNLAVLAGVAAAVGVALPGLLDVGEALEGGEVRPDLVAAGVQTLLGGALVVAVLVGLVAVLERHRPPSERATVRIRRAGTVVAAVGVAALLAGTVAVAGNPVDRAQDGWASFKQGYEGNDPDASRFVGGLGSGRYDFYRVSLDQFTASPLLGAGADNYFADYLATGRTDETPRYPHSLQMRTLGQTGAVGALLLLLALGAATWAAAGAMRRRDALGRAVAGGALFVAVFWAAHGSVDWFWEWAGVSAPAWAMLGLACGLATRGEATDGAAAADGAPAAADTGRRPRRRPVLLALGAVGGLVAAASITAPWLADRAIQRAALEWPTAPQQAFDRLDRAASLNPLSQRPFTIAGSIALRRDDLDRADAAFARALQRTPDDAYAALERGAIASSRGEDERAVALLGRAVALDPRNDLARDALRSARAGERVDVAELNDEILRRARRLGG